MLYIFMKKVAILNSDNHLRIPYHIIERMIAQAVHTAV